MKYFEEEPEKNDETNEKRETKQHRISENRFLIR